MIFEKLTTGKVLLKRSTGELIASISASANILAPTGKPDIIILDDRVGDTSEFNHIELKVNSITIPAAVDRNDLVRKLSQDYFTDPSAVVSLDAVGLNNASDVRINPATEEKQDLIKSVLDTIYTCCQAIDANTDEIESKLDSLITLVTSLDGKDFATETTLAAILVDTGSIISQLITLNGVDFATETTLLGIKAKTDLLTFEGDELKVITTAKDSEGNVINPSTEDKQDIVITELEYQRRVIFLLNNLILEQRSTNNLLKIILTQ